MKIMMTVGLSGSGKTTWAKKQCENNVVRICPDEIRTMLFGFYKFVPQYESYVFGIATSAAYMAFHNGYDVIIDATNITFRQRLHWYNIAQKFDADIELYVFKEEKNNLENRMNESRGLPAETWDNVIKNQRKKYKRPTIDEYKKCSISISWIINHIT